MIDTVRQDHLPTYGYSRNDAPTIDRLAREGAAANCVAPSSWTKPSTASLLTGLHPLRHQAIGRSDGLGAGAITLAQVLRDYGYQTLGVSANSWISKDFGFDRGFDEFELLEESENGHASARDVNNRLTRPIAALKQPYFLYVHYIDPHEPYNPQVAWDGSRLSPGLSQRVPFSLKGLEAATAFSRPPDVVQGAIDLYDGAIRDSDEGVANLLHSLSVAGLLSNTLTVITSDHGEEFEDHGRMSHGQTLYQEVVRVPLIFHSPGQIPAGTRLASASLLDVFDTVLDLLAVPSPASKRDGVSLATSLRASGSGPIDTRKQLLHLDIESGSSVALIEADRKLVLSKKPYGKELFDIARDPREKTNLFVVPEQDRVVRLLLTDVVNHYNDLSRRSLKKENATLSESTARKLMALGYLAPAETARRIPVRISAADMIPIGLLGWEAAAPSGCIQVAESAYENQLLEGWFYPELGGRWTGPKATLLLRAPDVRQPMQLIISGESFRTDLARLQVLVNGRVSPTTSIEPGDFRREFDMEAKAPGQGLLVEFVVQPPFRPADRGLPDHRELGLLLRTVCVKTRLPDDRPDSDRGREHASAAAHRIAS